MVQYGPEEWWYPNGDPAANQNAYVFEEDQSTLASIFSDAGLTTPLANPTTTDANGLLTFHAAAGEYWIFVGRDTSGDSVLVTLGGEEPGDGTLEFVDDRVSVSTGTGLARWYNRQAQTLTIHRVWVSAGVVPTGQDLIVDVHLNGTTIYTTQANRPVVADGTNGGAATVPDVTLLAAGDFLSIDIDQIGSGAAGGVLTVGVVVSHAG